MEFVVNIDTAVIDLSDAIAGSMLGNAELLINTDTPGVIRFTLDAPSGLTGAGSLTYLTFAALGGEGTSSALAFGPVDGMFAMDRSGDAVEVTTIDGSILVAVRTLSGDNDGDNKITELDAVVALQMALGLTPEDLFLDLDGSGAVTVEDARLILQSAVSGE